MVQTYRKNGGKGIKTKRMIKGKLYSKRIKCRPRKKWLEDVENDLKKMNSKGWKIEDEG
jgi:hypothetical protein